MNAAGRVRWQERAACRGTNPAGWFPDGGASDAPRACVGRPVRTDCLDYALTNNIEHGIWGGIPEGRRRELVKHLTATQIAALVAVEGAA